MPEINLLSKGLRQNTSLFKVLNYVKTINLVGTVLFILSTIILLVLIALNAITINGISGNIEDLKIKVQARKQSEQQYFLLKNRLLGVKQVYSSPKNLFPEIKDFSNLYYGFGSLAEINSVDISLGKVKMVAAFGNAVDLKAFFEKALGSNYERVVLDALSFRPGGGYQAQVSFSLKDK